MAYITPNKEPGIYMDPFTVVFSVDSSVANIASTDDGSNPTIAKYIAYDNLNPPNPFIATVQDGRGNVLFDGGFPKYYNHRCNTSWNSFSDLNNTFKYFYNALDWIANDDKVAEGNRKILFLGDAIPGESYNIKQTGGSDFKTSIETMCRIGNWDPTYKVRTDFSGNQIDLSYADLEPYAAVFLMSSRHTSNKYITDNTVNNILAFREAGNGMFIITDHGSSANTGFYKTANYIAEELGAYFIGDYDRSPVNVGYLIDNYGNHPLWNGMARSDSISAGGSESEIIVDETPTTTTADSLTVNEQGFKTARFLIELDSGEKVFETYSYGLNAGDPVTIHNDLENGVEKIGFGRTIDLEFTINLGIMDSASGLVKRNSDVLAQWSKDSSNRTTEWFTDSGNNTIKVDNGDNIEIEMQNPVYYSESFTVNAAPRDSSAISINLKDKRSEYISVDWTYNNRIELDYLEFIFLKNEDGGTQVDIDDDGTLEDKMNLNNASSYSVSNLEPATEYKYKLRVYDKNGGSLDSDYYTTKTDGAFKVKIDNNFKVPKNMLVKKDSGWVKLETSIKRDGNFKELDTGNTIRTQLFNTDMWSEFSKEVRAIHLIENDSDIYNTELIDVIEVIDFYGGTAELVKSDSLVETYVDFTSTDGPGQPAGFTYMVENAEGKKHIGHCQLDITEPPTLVANDDSFDIYEGGFINIYKSQMLDNDYDEGGNGPIEIIGFSDVTGGSLTEYDNYVRFDVTSLVGEAAEFKYTITNTIGLETTAYVKLIIRKGLIAGTDTIEAYKDIEKTIPLSTLDVEDISENPPVILTGLSNVSGATATHDDSSIYIKPTDPDGTTISFNYSVKNDIDLTDTGTVSIGIQPTPQLQASDDTFEVTQGKELILSKSDLSDNDSDAGGFYPLTVTNVHSPIGGNLNVSGDTITFESTGLAGEEAGFKYDIKNTQGITQTGNVYITVNPLPAVEALVYNSTAETEAVLDQYTPPTMKDMFDDWYRFAHSGSSIKINPVRGYSVGYVDLYSEDVWTYNSSTDEVICQINSVPYIGFISNDTIENFTFEANFRAIGDDDAMSFVIAFVEENGDEYTLSAVRDHGGSNSGTIAGNNHWAIYYNYKRSSADMLDYVGEGTIRVGSGSWSSYPSGTNVKVEREGNIITAYTSQFGEESYVPSSKLTVDLDSDPKLHKFKGEQRYGYGSHSQNQSTFSSINIQGGMNKNKIYNFDTGEVYVYNENTMQWEVSDTTIQDEIGYVREVVNPETGDRYLVKENEIIKMT